jgi:anti-sigma28 factor (negative regulator of flagellin synthesis)
MPILQKVSLINPGVILYGEIPMRFKKVTPLAPPQERRRFGRIHISEPRICHVHLPQSRELWTGYGQLVNISLGGFYFVCDQQPPVKKDDICYLTFATPQANNENYRFGFHVSVVRTGQVQLCHPQFALALKIISEPVYYSPGETNKREVTALDKPRILYQYYDLNKKAYEIITNTPDLRTEKVKSLKQFIEKGSYDVKSDKIAQSVINDIFMEDLLLAKK